MKELYLIRHAKSDWSDLSKNDFERGLNKRGKKNIIIMGDVLNEMKIKPDLILSSSAKRAKRTVKGLAEEINYKGDILFLDELYMCEPEQWIETIRSIDERYESVFIVGHNPEITELTNMLIDDYIDNVPTLGIVSFDVKIKKWKRFDRDSAFFEFFIYPKMYQ